ncbi:MAG TPA: ABC transporter permease [Ktedonobacteraceae bacterium]
MLQHEAIAASETRTAFSIQCRRLWRVILAETLKQHRILFGSKLVYFSLLIWPGLELATAYYTFRPFLNAPGIANHWSLAANPRAIALFFITGMLGFTFFWSLVQSAWQFSWERFNGTLELLFLSPANRLVLIIANGTGALIQSVWLFLTFTIGLITIIGGLNVANPAMYMLAFFGLLIPAMAWATFLNSFFIFARDAGFLYTLFEGTMSFFAGVRIPLFAFPLWIRIIGILFPLTTSLVVLRGALLEGATPATLWPQLLFLTGISIALFAVAAWLLKCGEENARRNGSLTLF